MPTSLKRLLLVLVLAVAVPLQGYAAAGIELCRASAHHGDPAATAHAHHGVDSPSAHYELPRLPAGGTEQESHHCAACATCGVAAVISAAPALHASDTPHQGVLIATLPAPEGYVPEGLDRPPLTLLV